MDKKAKTFFPAISRISNFKTRLLFGFATIFLILSIIYFAYRHLSNTTMQYVVLVIVLFFMSMIIFMKAFERVEWKEGKEVEHRAEGQLKRMSRRIFLASRGFTFTQDLLRQRVKKMFDEEGISPRNDHVMNFLVTSIEGKGHSQVQGKKFMKDFSDAITILEESI